MNVLYHFPLCPYSRYVRAILLEKNVEFELVQENYFEHNEYFASLNPAFETPVLVENRVNVFADTYAIIEYLEEKYQEARSFIPQDAAKAAEVRRIVSWFNNKFYREVCNYIVTERVIKCYTQSSEPNSEFIRVAKTNLQYHMQYVEFLLRDNKYLAGDTITIADFAAACNFSILDYFNDIPWEKYQKAKLWYALLKSRPSFKPILADRVPGFFPAKHYMDPDF